MTNYFKKVFSKPFSLVIGVVLALIVIGVIVAYQYRAPGSILQPTPTPIFSPSPTPELIFTPIPSLVPSPSPSPLAIKQLTLFDIMNATLNIADGSLKTITLKDGRYVFQYCNSLLTGGSCTFNLDRITFGDLNGDGLADAAAQFNWRAKGDKPIYGYVVFLNNNGKPEHIFTTDFTVVWPNSLKIKNSVLTIDYNTVANPDGTSTGRTVREYKFEGAGMALIQITPK